MAKTDRRLHGWLFDLVREFADKLAAGLIVPDANMPEPDGFAVHKQLTERAVDLPVIMMSGSGDLTVLAMKARVAEFMQNPLGRGELFSVLAQLSAKDHRA